MTDRKETGWWTSLRGRLILIALIAFLPLFGLLIYQAVESRQYSLAEARVQVNRMAKDAESELAAHIQGARQLAHAMAANPVLLGNDFAACSAVLAAQLKLGKRYASFALAGHDGKLLCSSDPAAGPVNYSDRDHFRRVIETRQPVVGKPVIGRVAKNALVPVAQPFLDANGEVRRVLLAGLDIAWIGEKISEGLPSADLTIVLSDEEGRILYRWPQNEKWGGHLDPRAPINLALSSKRPGEPFDSVDVEGVARIWAIAHSREHAGGSLAIRAGATREALTAAADRELAAALAVLFVVAGLVLSAVIFLAERFVRAPVVRLAHAADQLGKGKLSERVAEAEFSGELAGLAASFNAMAAGLAARTAQLQEKEAQLQTVFENLAEGVVLSRLDGQVLQFNRAAVEMFGFHSGEDYLRRQPEFADTFELSALDGTVLHTDRWPLALVLRDEALRDVELVTRHLGDGWRKILSYGGTLVRGEDGGPLLAILTVRDVTERVQAERKMRAQLDHLNLLDQITRATGERQDLKSIFQVVVRSLEDSLPMDFGCICLYDAAANALTVICVGVRSEALARELTMDVSATIGIDDNGLGRCVKGDLVYEPDIGQVRFPFPERLARGGLRSVVLAPLKSESRVFGLLVAARRATNGFNSGECEFLRQLSEHIALAAHQAQLYGALRQAYDDLRRTQAAMLQEERLRVLGQMASGIAHDINNALSPVSLYAESMLDTEMNLSERGRGYLATIQRSVEDVAQTVARMREFYRPREQQMSLTAVQMNDMVRQVVELTKARWSDQPLQSGIVIHAVTELAPDLPKIMGVEGEIREALTNLIFNAVDAMPKGGTLTLRTRVADAGTDLAAVIVEVADSGIGMDEDTRQRCLEPFFTTKGERGTGLGLAMVFGMMQRHSAEMEIESARGAGTTMRLLFAVPAAIVVVPGQPAAPPKVPSRLQLLLIDDDPILLKSLRDALENDSHVIVTANGGEQGIAAFRLALDRKPPFDAVITDLGMPYVDGRRVAVAVKEISPATPVIMLTGWGRRMVSEGDIPPHVDRVLAKPPKLRELRETLAQLCRPQPPEQSA